MTPGPGRCGLLLGCVFALTLLSARTSAQEPRVEEPLYLTVDVGVTGAVNDPPEDQFEIGGDAAIGLYYSLIPELALGGRILGGALAAGHPVPQDPVERGVGDYGLLAASVRVAPFGSLMADHTNHRAAGLYLEASPGIGVFDGEIVPGYTASLGYNFAAGPISVGPKFRFTHFIETAGRFGDNDVLMITGGLELAFMDEASVIEPPPVPPPAADPEPEPVAVVSEPPLELERVEEPPVNDALIVDERAYFDYDEAALRPDARVDLDAVFAHWREYGDRYERLVIAGHADERGSREYNEALSAARALAVANHLISAGVPVEVLDIRAEGEAAPLVAEPTTEREHQVNRRVQFAVQWDPARRPIGVAPEPDPTMPAYADAAPERVRRHAEARDDLEPPAGVASRAQRLFQEQQQALRQRIDRPVTVALRESSADQPTARVEIRLEGSAMAAR